jgi:beta-galactosidase
MAQKLILKYFVIFNFLVLNINAKTNEKFIIPTNQRVKYCMNPDWLFIKGDINGAQQYEYSDLDWERVSIPHTYNENDTFDELITSNGEKSQYTGIAWYRKHFKIPNKYINRKIFIEFEGIKQAARFYLNGKLVDKYENGITPCGIDITDFVNFGDKDNILAVRIDNSNNYIEESTGTVFQWTGPKFNPNYGGINKNVWLHITGKIYQTLPLYENLKTIGTYIYAKDISVSNKNAEIQVESEIKNETGDPSSVNLSVIITDTTGNIKCSFEGETYDIVNGEKSVLKASGIFENITLWDIFNPYLYDVFTILKVDGQIIDVNCIRTGFRKVEFKGGAGTGGVWLNDKFVYLKGYAQRSTNEWAGLGQAYPDWMHDYTAKCVKNSNANYIRWMHITPQRADVTACDKYGIVQICPAGDMESDVTGRQWEQRKEVMRASIIYFRNSPSILFYEAGNASITPQHMQEMLEIKNSWDPKGMRAMGCRSLFDANTNKYTEYLGVMIGQDPRTDALQGYTDMFRGYSTQRRDLFPIIECEDYREEAARRFWDDYSPPYFGFHKKPNDTYNLNSETYCIGAIKRYYEYYSQRICNADKTKSKWSGYASIIFTDTNSHGRQYDSEVCRNSGKMDAVRIPKQSYFAFRVMQNEKPDIHIIGHWNYPDSTIKNIYVVSNCETVELFVNGLSKGKTKPENGYLFTFNNIKFEAGRIKAIGYNNNEQVCSHEIETSGTPKQIKLTLYTGYKGFMADGSDVSFIDVEIVDSAGNRCPTDESKIEFELEGPAIWRGGYNSGIVGSTNNKYLYTECGINRVAIRSTLIPGNIKITAKREGLPSQTITFQSIPVEIENGLIEQQFSHSEILSSDAKLKEIKVNGSYLPDFSPETELYLYFISDTTFVVPVVEAIPNDINAKVTILPAGNFNDTVNITVTAQDLTTKTYKIILLQKNDNKIAKSQNIDFKIFPNPTRQYLFLELNKPVNNLSIKLFNINGLELLSDKLKYPETISKYDLSFYPKGIYIFKITAENRQNEKIILYK